MLLHWAFTTPWYSFTIEISTGSTTIKNYCHYLRTTWFTPPPGPLKINEKYQKGNMFDFYKMSKNITKIPDRWQILLYPVVLSGDRIFRLFSISQDHHSWDQCNSEEKYFLGGGGYGYS